MKGKGEGGHVDLDVAASEGRERLDLLLGVQMVKVLMANPHQGTYKNADKKRGVGNRKGGARRR